MSRSLLAALGAIALLFAQAAPSFAEAADVGYAELAFESPAEDVVEAPEVAADPLEVGFAQLGKPYIWGSAGGRSRFDLAAPGFDCSGFVSFVERVGFGRATGSTTTTLYAESRPVAEPEYGDLAFWGMGQRNMHLQHVAFYLGDGMILQAGGRRNNVNIDSANAIGRPEFRRLP